MPTAPAPFSRRIACSFAALSFAGLSACGGTGDVAEQAPAAADSRDIAAIQAGGTLRVATRNAPTTWYIDRREQAAGPEYDLALAYAEHLGVELELVEHDSIAKVLNAVEHGKADLAAAGLTATPARAQRFAFGPNYRTIDERVVCNREGKRAKSIDDLADVSLTVADNSSYAETLSALQADNPAIKFATKDTSTESLLRKVWKGKLDCTVADSNIWAINRRYFPELISDFSIATDKTLAWMLPKGATALQQSLSAWASSKAAKSRLAVIDERYYAPYAQFDYVDMRAFVRRIDARYPKYDSLFEGAGEDYSVDHVLLAAQGYQESHWEADAKSPTGVRGIMMLTRNTAESLGVEDRLDPEQSIEGGAKYLAKMKTRFDDAVTEPDLTYLALAAYNVGRAHLHDAQKLARERGLSPYVWEDVRQVLPLLSDKSVYPKLKYGYARGHEPVRYVERIQNYEDVLDAQLAAK